MDRYVNFYWSKIQKISWVQILKLENFLLNLQLIVSEIIMIIYLGICKYTHTHTHLYIIIWFWKVTFSFLLIIPIVYISNDIPLPSYSLHHSPIPLYPTSQLPLHQTPISHLPSSLCIYEGAPHLPTLSRPTTPDWDRKKRKMTFLEAWKLSWNQCFDSGFGVVPINHDV